jgi:hypothetical protein
MARLVFANRRLLFQDNGAEVRIALGELPGSCQSDDSAADDGDVGVGHGAIS